MHHGCAEEGQQGQLAAAALNALTTLEGLLPALGRDTVLCPLLAARPASGERLLPAPLLGPLLCPHPQMDPLLRNRIAGLVLQVELPVHLIAKLSRSCLYSWVIFMHA